MGVPVKYDENAVSASVRLDRLRWWWPWRSTLHPCLCESRGIWRWRKIVIGRAFLAFPPREQQAILLHEVGHVKMGHIWQRAKAFWKVIFRPTAFAALCQRQEFEADRFAAHCGYGAELAQVLGRVQPAQNAMHPPAAERIARLLI